MLVKVGGFHAPAVLHITPQELQGIVFWVTFEVMLLFRNKITEMF